MWNYLVCAPSNIRRPAATTSSASVFGDFGSRYGKPVELKWATRDSNPDGLPHTPLKRARLPVPPAARLSRLILPFGSAARHGQEGGHGRPVTRRRIDPLHLSGQALPER